jgi:DNA-binding transcriptional LysR family regulator
VREPDLSFQRGTPKNPEDLSKHDCIAFEGLTSPQAWTFRTRKGEREIPVHSRLSVTTAEAAIDAAVGDMGLTRVLSYMVEDLRRAEKLKIVLERFEPKPWPVNLVYASQGFLPLKLRTFLDWAGPRLKARLEPIGK